MERRSSSLGSERRAAGALALLRLVHEQPGLTRAEAARRLGLSSGSATEITARLRERRLVAEGVASDGRRGRPSGRLVAHPSGPVVCAVEIAHGGWRVAVVELGGEVVEEVSGRPRREPRAALAEVERAVARVHERLGPRLRAVAVSAAGTVVGDRLVEAATLGWRDVELRRVVPPSLAVVPFVAGNDATLAGLAEARRGVARDVPVVLALVVGVGVGGVLLVDGRPLLGATGEAGEFGHMPFGDPSLRCPCGARGCWDLEVDGRALARHLGRRPPADPRAFAERTLAAARSGGGAEARAVADVAGALGRGTAAVVNALDPQLVVLGGLAADLLAAAPGPLRRRYRDGLMRHRRREPPRIVASALGPDGALLGAAEAAFDAVLKPRLLEA